MINISPYVIPGISLDVPVQKRHFKEQMWDIAVNLICKIDAIPVEKLYDRRQNGVLVRARKKIIYLIHRHTNLSLKDIGNRIGGFNHANIYFHHNTMSNAISVDKELKKEMGKIESEFLYLIRNL